MCDLLSELKHQDRQQNHIFPKVYEHLYGQEKTLFFLMATLEQDTDKIKKSTRIKER